MQITNPGALTSAAGIRRIRPSRLWYVAASLLLAGAVTCLALGVASFFGLNRQIQDFQRVSVPGQALITLSHPGEYVLYVEGPGHCCSFTTGDAGQAPFARWSMRVAMRLVAGGPPVSISTWGKAIDSYAVTGHQGQTAMYFTIRYPGVYVLDTSDVTPQSIADLAVGRPIGAPFIPIALILAAIFALGPAGLTVGGVTAFRRRGHRNRPPPPWSAQQVLAQEPAVAEWGQMPTPGLPAPRADGLADSAAATGVLAAPGYGPRPPETMSLPGTMPPGPMLPPTPMPPTPMPPTPMPPPDLMPPPASAGASLPSWQAAEHEAIWPPPGLPVRRDQARLPGRTRRPVMLLLIGAGAGIAILAGLLYLVRSASTAPTSATQPGTAAPATRPAVSTPSAHTRPSPAPRSAAAPLTRAESWLKGLTALQVHMNNAGPPNGVPVTPEALRVTAGKLRRCTPELAGLGPPPSPLRVAYKGARQACADFERGAKCYAAAAPVLNSAQAGKLLNSCAADTNHGSDLIGLAVAEGSSAAPGN